MTDNAPLWSDSAPTPLPRLEGRVTADVCVVGLGGSGLACVRALIEAGKRVVGVDAVSVAAGAAGRNAGFLLGGLAMFHHQAVEQLGAIAANSLYEETLRHIDRMVQETPTLVRRSGSLRIASSEEERADCAKQLSVMRASGLPVEVYHGPEGTGLLFPADAAFDPAARCRALAADALSKGARLFERSPAEAVGEGVVRTAHGEVRAGHIVVAVDGALERVLPELEDRVRSVRLQILGTGPALGVEWPRPVYARWGLDYWQQLPDRRIVLGGCRDVGGDAEWTVDNMPTDLVQSALTSLLRDLCIDAPITHRWAATVGYTQNGLPIIEQVRPDVWAIGAYSGTGNVVGALCARAVVETIVTGRSRVGALLRG